MRTILVACGAIAVAGFAVSAQTLQPNSQTPRPSTQASSPAGKVMTVTGCLKPLDGMSMNTPAGPTAPAGSPGSGSGAAGTPMPGRAVGAQYLLTNVEHGAGSTMPDRPAGSPTGSPAGATTSGAGATGAPTPPAAMHGSFVLRAEESTVKLSAHVNHKIQVTGEMQEPMGGNRSTTPNSGTAGTPAGAPSRGTMDEMSAPVLIVTSVQMVSSTCP